MTDASQPSIPPSAGKPLSERELQVLAMTAEGLTNVETAKRLDVTVHAVKFHLASIYRKLGVTNRTEAAVTYMRRQETANHKPGR